MDIQPALFQEQETAAPDPSLPDDVAEAMKVLNGQVSFGDPPLPAGIDPAAGMNAQERWQQSLLKKHEIDKAQMVNHGYEVHALDLAVGADRKRLQDIMDRVASAPSHQISMTRERTILDPRAEAGYRMIVMVMVWKMKKVIPAGTDMPDYEVLKKSGAVEQ